MTSTGHRTDRDHPIAAALSAIGDELTAVEHAPAWSLIAAETGRALVEATRLVARLSALELKVAAQADRSATQVVRRPRGCGGPTTPG